jgi:hypothetical protein
MARLQSAEEMTKHLGASVAHSRRKLVLISAITISAFYDLIGIPSRSLQGGRWLVAGASLPNAQMH